MKMFKQAMMELKFGKTKLIQLMICLVGALAAFIGLTALEQSLLAPNGLKQVIVAKVDIGQNQLITKENYSTLFETIERDPGTISGDAITSSDLIFDKLLNKSLLKGNYVSEKDLVDKGSLIAEMIEPVEFTITGNDISKVVGGTIREGDIINIGIIDETSKDYVDVQRYAYVDSVMNSEGAKLEKKDTGTAVIIGLIASRQDKDNILSRLAKGQVTVSRVIDLNSINDKTTKSNEEVSEVENTTVDNDTVDTNKVDNTVDNTVDNNVVETDKAVEIKPVENKPAE